MQENVKKFYSIWQITWATLIASPLAAGWLMGQNYKQLGQPEKTRKANIIGFVCTLALLIAAIFLPESFPNLVLPVITAIATKNAAREIQGKQIAAQFALGAEKHSGWKVFGISLIIFLLALVIGVVVVLGLDAVGLLPE